MLIILGLDYDYPHMRDPSCDMATVPSRGSEVRIRELSVLYFPGDPASWLPML